MVVCCCFVVIHPILTYFLNLGSYHAKNILTRKKLFNVWLGNASTHQGTQILQIHKVIKMQFLDGIAILDNNKKIQN